MCIWNCVLKPCCKCSNEELKKRLGYISCEKDAYEIIYQNRIIGKVGYIPIVGDSIFGYTVWEVDYKHKYAYVTD